MTAYRRVTFEDRCLISALRKIKLSIAEIANQTGFNKSTISRELRRNGEKSYLPRQAHQKAQDRFMACRRPKKIRGSLEELVVGKITDDWSPEQVAGRLYREHKLELSHTTIYKYIHEHHEQQSVVRKSLRKVGKGGCGRLKRRRRPEWMLKFSDRPKVIGNRRRFGDWERDTLYAKDRKQVIVCVDRRSRYIKVARVKEPYCLHLTEQTKALLQGTGKLRSITNDNGSEFQDGFQFNVPVYYCDPRSPHQRGTVENQIGLVRQYITRKTDLTQLSDEQIQAIENKLNHRPRKCLDWKTPHEVFFQATVALAS